MAILSLDNLSSEHFGFWSPIELKLIPSTIHYKSGIGKTAICALAIIQQMAVDEGLPRILALCHTREIACQIGKEDGRFCKFMPSMKGSVFYKIIPLKSDIDTLKNGKPQMVVATPGRLLDFVKRKALSLDDVKHFIIDECDKVLEHVSMRADLRQIRNKNHGIYSPRWRTKMAAPIFN